MKSNNYTTIKHLKQFYNPSQQIFQDAKQLPQFFNTNLVDDARVVKYFHKDPQANIRIFYYQYLKLCFQIDNVDYQSYIQKIYELIRTQGFQFYFNENDKQKQYKNAQYKSLLIDFFEIMNTSTMTIQQVLSQYPILDQVFTNFFRTVVIIASVASEYDSYIDKNQLFDFLSSFFSVDISSYQKCLKFVESDIFVYEQNPQNIYMAYIKDQDQDVQKNQNYQSKHSYQTQQINTVSQSAKQLDGSHQIGININVVQTNNSEQQKNSFAPQSSKQQNSLKPRAKTIIKESYIEGQFADYTSYTNISAFGKNIPIQYQKDVSQTIQNKTLSNKTELNNKNQQNQSINLQNKNDKQLKRVLSAQNHVKFDPSVNQNNTPNQNEQKINPFLKGNSQPNLLSSQNNQNMVQSFYDHGQSGFNNQQKDHIQNEDQSNSKQSKKSKSFNRNLLYHNFQQPTKDPGFDINQTINVKPVQSTIYHANPSRQMASSLQSNSLGSQAQIKRNLQILNNLRQVQKIQTKTNRQYNKNILDQQSLFHKPSIPLPTLLNPYGLAANSKRAFSSQPEKQIINTPNNNLNLGINRQSLKLNVTKQFTNSFVMKSMAEPYKGNVYQIRQRARQYRKNIYQQFNYPTTNIKTSIATNLTNYESNSNQYNLKKVSSRTNLPSQDLIQKVTSSNHLATDSHIKLPQNKNYNQQTNKNIQIKDFKQQIFTNQIDNNPRKISQVKQVKLSISQLNSDPNIIKPNDKKQNAQKQSINAQHNPIKYNPNNHIGPSIVIQKQSNYINQPVKLNINIQQNHIIHKSPPHAYKLSQRQIPKNNIPSNQQLYQQQIRVQQIQSMNYSNPLQSYQPVKINNNQYQKQINQNPTVGIPIMNQLNRQTSNNNLIKSSSNSNLIYPQQNVKKQLPVYVPYQRRK